MRLERNASVCMKALPFWILPYTFYMYYLSLYLMEMGLSSEDVTSLMMISNISAMAFSFFSSPIVDKLGRRISLLIFDILSSSLPALIFFLSTNYVLVAFGMILTGLNRIMSTAYYLLMIEDTSDENSMNAMNIFNIISIGAGILTPIAGVVVSKLGVIKGEKLFLIVSVVLMTTQAIVRHFFVSETKTGEIVRENFAISSRKSMFQMYPKTLKWLLQTPSAIRALVVNAFVYVYYTVATTSSLLFTPYFSLYRNLRGVVLSLVGGIYSGATLFTMLIVNPRLKGENIRRGILYSCAISILGFILVIFAPNDNLYILFIAIVGIALSYGNLKSVSDALLAFECEVSYGSTLYSFSYILSALLSVFSLKIVEKLYSISPDWLFGFSSIIMVFVFIFSFGYKLRRSDNG